MPYIRKERRNRISINSDRIDEMISLVDIENAGELNYAITKMIIHYFKRKGNYQAINDIVGAIDSAKLEFYRRVASKYEDGKIKENGDVYR